MKVSVNVTGITFRTDPKKNPEHYEEARAAKPKGVVDLVHEPDNKFDKRGKAIMVMKKGLHLGYIPAVNGGDKLQDAILKCKSESRDVIGIVERYQYFDEKTDSFNEKDEGIFQALRICIVDKEGYELYKAENNDVAKKEPTTKKSRGSKKDSKAYDPNDNNKEFYLKDGKKYERLSTVLGSYKGTDKYAEKGLDTWKFERAIEGVDLNEFNKQEFADEISRTKALAKEYFTAYESALNSTSEAGTCMHDSIEKWILGDKDLKVPIGFTNWWNKHEPEIVATETTVFNDDYMIAGTFDFLCKIKGHLVAVDWKSSKAVRSKHKKQVAWYATEAKADAGLVVAFGATTKQGYSQSWVKDEEMIRSHEQIGLIKRAMDLDKKPK